MDAPPQRQCGHPPDRIRQRPSNKGGRRCLDCEAAARRAARAAAPKRHDPRPRDASGQFLARAPAGAAAPPPPPPDDVEILSEDPPLSSPLGHDPNADTQECAPLSDTLLDTQGHEPPVSDTAQAGDSGQNGKQDLAAGGKATRHQVRRAESHLIISDLQIPYHAPGALAFAKDVQREYGAADENVLCVGDEFDFYWLSRFDHSPDSEHSPKGELAAAREEAARWGAAFPKMRVCLSNHGDRPRRAAHRAMIPSDWIRSVREVLGLPEGWRWADHWIVKGSKAEFRVEHGHARPGGHAGLRLRPLWRGISTAWGHEHAEPGCVHVDTNGGQRLWGMRTGSLLTREPVAALSYNAEDASRPVGSVGVVLDGGRLPLVVRM